MSTKTESQIDTESRGKTQIDTESPKTEQTENSKGSGFPSLSVSIRDSGEVLRTSVSIRDSGKVLRASVRAQLEWCEVFNQLTRDTEIRCALSELKICVYVTAGKSPHPKAPPPHRYLHVVSEKKIDQAAYDVMLKAESDWWNAFTPEEKIAQAEARVGGKWGKTKLLERLVKKGFQVRT
jgi:hypothetical protein